MPKKNLKRINKTKKQVVSEIQLSQTAERVRSIIKDILFPHLLEIDESISYTRIFLQAFSGMVEGALDSERKNITIEQLAPKLNEKLSSVFKMTDPEQKKEHDRYLKLMQALKGVSVYDLSLAMDLPRQIEGYLIQEKGKESIKSVDIEKILG